MANYTKQQLQQIAYNTAVKYGVPPQIVMGIIDRESGWKPQSKNYSKIESSQGLMQINIKAHPDYKGGYDPVKNIDYGVKLLAGLNKRYGSWAKAVERYNGSGQAARDYSADIMNNRVKKYTDIVANMKSMPTDIAITPTNESGMTGAAAGMNLPSNDSRYVVQAPNVQDVRASVINPQDEATYINQALGSPRQSQFNNMLQSYLSGQGGITYEQMINSGRALGIPTEQLEKIPEINPDAQVDRMAKKIMGAYTPENSMAKQQMQLQALQQLQQANPNTNIADKIQAAYDRYNQIIESDPRLQNGGYYVDPNQAERDFRANASRYIRTGDPRFIQSQADVARQQYEYNIANQAGVPYETYMAAQGDRIKAQSAAQLQMAQDMLSAGQINSADYAKMLAQFQNIINQDSAILGKQIEQIGGITKQSIANAGDLAKQGMTNTGNVQTTGMTNAAKLEGDNLAFTSNYIGDLINAQKATADNMLNVDKATLDAQVNKYNTDVQANTSRANTLDEQATKRQELNVRQPVYDAQADYYNATGFLNRNLGNMYVPQTPQVGQPEGLAGKMFFSMFRNRGVQPQIGGQQ